jgi:hypothetical protein
MRILTVTLFVGCLAISDAEGQSEPPVNNEVVLTVSIASEQSEFHIGEKIPVQLSYTSPLKDKYQVNMALYDRSGRMEYEQFTVLPLDGAVDPLANRKGGIGGGATGFKFLSAEPWTIS